MTTRMLISSDEEESRVAIVANDRLENLEIEAKRGAEGRRGNVYKGVVHKVEQSLQAAFVDFGEEKQGFLPLSEIHRRLWPDGITEKRPDITKILKEKQELLVQVVKDEIGTKGATLTTHVSLPGRYLVLMPETEKHGISRRLSDAERRRLKETIDSIGVPDGFGVIIRTAGQQQRPLELKKDLLYLTRLFDSIEANHKRRKRAGLVYKDRSHAVRFIRDYYHDAIDEIWVDSRSVLKEISEFISVLMPGTREKLRLYEGQAPLFIKFGVEDQVESVFARQVHLPAGGSIVIDQTEALVAVDVNSGRVKGEDIEETALKTNLEAAAEVARQVKIRDLGGLVVVDFIDMRDRKNVRAVEQAVRKAFADDKAKTKFGRISSFGLMELSRQRLRKSLATTVKRRCPACDGTGMVRAPASAALSLLRRIEEACLRGTVRYVRATCPVGVANVLLNRRRRELAALESKMGVIVEIAGHADMAPNLVALDVVVLRKGRQTPQRIYQLLDLIRNQVVGKESSPLPKPEDGLDALELDHAAIYQAIKERDYILRAEEALASDFEYAPQEPELTEDEEAAPKRKRKRHKDAARRDAERAARVEAPEEVLAEKAEPADPAADVSAGTPETPKRSGFVAWLKAIFGVGEEEPAAPLVVTPIDDEAVAVAEAEHEKRREEARSRRHENADGRGQRRGRDRDRDRDDDDDGDERRSRRRRRGRNRRRGEDDRGSQDDRGGRSGDTDSAGRGEGVDDDRKGRRRGRSGRNRSGEGEGGGARDGRSGEEDGGRRRRRRRSADHSDGDGGRGHSGDERSGDSGGSEDGDGRRQRSRGRGRSRGRSEGAQESSGAEATVKGGAGTETGGASGDPSGSAKAPAASAAKASEVAKAPATGSPSSAKSAPAEAVAPAPNEAAAAPAEAVAPAPNEAAAAPAKPAAPAPAKPAPAKAIPTPAKAAPVSQSVAARAVAEATEKKLAAANRARAAAAKARAAAAAKSEAPPAAAPKPPTSQN